MLSTLYQDRNHLADTIEHPNQMRLLRRQVGDMIAILRPLHIIHELGLTRSLQKHWRRCCGAHRTTSGLQAY